MSGSEETRSWAPSEASWRTPPLRDLVMYEMMISEFAADIGEALGITRQAVYNRLHALEHRTQTDPDFVIPDLEETEES